MKAIVRGEEELGPQRRCRTCAEWWPADGEFWEPRAATCRACRGSVRERHTPPERMARRREQWRVAAARYTAKRRVVA